MLDKFKDNSKRAERIVGGVYISKTESIAGLVTCIAQQIPRLRTMHWRFNFKLDGKVISAKELKVSLNE